MTDNDPLPELKDMLERLARLRREGREDAAGDASYSLGAFVESECPALIAELEQLREVAAQYPANRAIGFVDGAMVCKIEGAWHISCETCKDVEEVLHKTPTLLEALEYLRSPAGVAAVASARGKGEA